MATTATEISQSRGPIARVALAQAIATRDAAHERLERGEAAARRAREIVAEAEERLVSRRQALESARELQAQQMGEQVRQGLPMSNTERTEEEEVLSKQCREAEKAVGLYQRMARDFDRETAELRSAAAQADAAVGDEIRGVVAEERDRLAGELEAALRNANAVRNQLEGLAYCFTRGQRAAEFPHAVLTLMKGGLDQFQVDRVRIAPGSPPNRPIFIAEQLGERQKSAWENFMRELEVDPQAQLRF